MDDNFDEVSVFAGFHLEAWTDETSAEVFHRACRTLRAAGIRVKWASAGDDVARTVEQALYSE